VLPGEFFSLSFLLKTQKSIYMNNSDALTKKLKKEDPFQTLFLATTMPVAKSVDVGSMIYLNPENPGKKIYIISGSQWNDLLPYITRVESQGYTVTNTAFLNYQQEMYNADSVVYLRGWGGTIIGRKMNELRKSLNIPVINRKKLFISDVEKPVIVNSVNDTNDLIAYRKQMKIPTRENKCSLLNPEYVKILNNEKQW